MINILWRFSYFRLAYLCGCEWDLQSNTVKEWVYFLQDCIGGTVWKLLHTKLDFLLPLKNSRLKQGAGGTYENMLHDIHGVKLLNLKSGNQDRVNILQSFRWYIYIRRVDSSWRLFNFQNYLEPFDYINRLCKQIQIIKEDFKFSNGESLECGVGTNQGQTC